MGTWLGRPLAGGGGGGADGEGSGGCLPAIVAKYNRAPGNRDVAGRRVRAWSLRFLTHPDVKN